MKLPFLINSVLTYNDITNSELKSFVRSLPFLEFRRYRSVDAPSDQRVLLKSIVYGISKSLITYISRVAGIPTGIAILLPLDWEKQFFGQPMAMLRLFVCGDNRQSVAKNLLTSILEQPHFSGQIALRLDAEDFDVRIVAEKFGFRIMDTLCTYEYHPSFSGFPERLRQRFHVRWYQPGDRSAVISIAEKCFSGYNNRFYLDPNIGPEKAKNLYITWAEKCCSGEMAEQLLVAEYHDQIIGFLGWRLHPDLLEYTHLRLHGAGLGGCLPARCNAYMELLWYAVRSLGGESADFDTHLSNFSTINTYQRLGFRYVKARHTMHLGRKDHCLFQ